MTCPITGRWTRPARDLYGHDKPFDLWDLTDDGLARMRRALLRETSDLARDGDLTNARRRWFEAREIHDHQLIRFRVRMRYGAVDDHVGTTSYDCFIRHDEAPSYALALFMDAARANSGRTHVLKWAVPA